MKKLYYIPDDGLYCTVGNKEGATYSGGGGAGG